MALPKSRAVRIVLIAVAVLVGLMVVGLIENARQASEPCPYIGTPKGEQLSPSEREWAISSFGKDTVNRCWR